MLRLRQYTDTWRGTCSVRLSWHVGLTLSLLSWKCVARTVCRVGRDRWRPSPGPGPAPSPALDPSLDTT